MRSVHLRSRAAFTLAVTGVLLGAGLGVPAHAATPGLTGTVFQDLNKNEAWDAGELGVPNVRVEVKDSAGTVVAGVATNAEGVYSFDTLAPGEYTVNASFAEFAVPVTVTDANDPVYLPYYAGIITGNVFDDLNKNGNADTDESLLPGIEVTASLNGTVVDRATTDSTGNYRFLLAAPGEYTVEAAVPAGQRITTSQQPVPLSGQRTVPRDIGLGILGEGRVELLTYEDVDGDGSQDSGEPGLGPVTFEIRDADGNVVPSDGTTAEDGTFATSLPEGTYTVTFTPPSSGLAMSPRSVTLNVPDGGVGTASFGVAAPAGYEGRIFIDADGDREYDAGETLIQGATVTLSGPGSHTTTTTSEGTYRVDGIKPGSYTVSVTLPDSYAGQVVSLNHTTTEVFRSGATVSADYFITGQVDAPAEPGAMTGRIYIDANKNREFDAGETPLTGTTISLKGADGKVYTTTVDASGSYSLANLPAGTYTVTVTVADAYKDKVSNPVYTSTATIEAGATAVHDYFITGAVSPNTGTGNSGAGNSGGTSSPTVSTQSRTTPSSQPARSTTSPQLAQTGVESTVQAGTALSLIAMGAALLGWRRRRTI